MDTIQKPRKPKAQPDSENPLAKQPDESFNRPEKNESRREVDIFQELRERKLKEALEPGKVSENDSANQPVRSVIPWARWVLAAFLVGVMCFFFVVSLESGNKKPAPVNKPAPEKVAAAVVNKPDPGKEVAAAIESLKSSHKARAWDNNIPEARRTNPFSFELSDAFLRDESRPVLARCTLIDIVGGRRNVEAIFALPSDKAGHQNLLILKCWGDGVKLFADGVRGASDFAVVAKCYEVQNNSRGCTILGDLIDARNLSTVSPR